MFSVISETQLHIAVAVAVVVVQRVVLVVVPPMRPRPRRVVSVCRYAAKSSLVAVSKYTPAPQACPH